MMASGKFASAFLGGAVLLSAWCVSAADYGKELAEVKSGIRQEAKASWWGFNKEDSTKALQAAINSGVKKLIVDNTGSDWIIEPVKLASDQEIVFEKDVVVSAKRGCFKKLTDSLFTASSKKNIVLRGEAGATLKMHKADYLDPAKYQQGEWRHAISIMSSSNVTISNLAILSSGGDGIYLGVSNPAMKYCKDILVEKVVCDDNNRQGISVISAENLTIKDSVFKNTGGALPEGGIDFEPNNRDERLVNCLVENCKFTGNKTYGVVFCLQTDTPVSIKVRNCDIENNKTGLAYAMASKADKVTGTVEVVDCKISGSSSASVMVERFSEGDFILKRCSVDNSMSSRPAIVIIEKAEAKKPGRILFDDVSVVDKVERSIFAYLSWMQHPKTSASGTINYVSNGVASKFDCALIRPPAIFQEEFTAAKLKDVSRLAPPAAGNAAKSSGSCIPVRHDNAKFLQYAAKGQHVSLGVMGYKVGKKNESKLAMSLKSPTGKELKKFELAPDNKFTAIDFDAGESGLYELECVKSRGNAFVVNADNCGNGYLIDGDLKITSPRGKLFFQVPAGVKDIKVEVFGDLGESVDVALLDPQGAKVAQLKGVESLSLLKCSRSDAAKSEVWALDFSNAVEDCGIRMGAPLVPVVSTSAENLLQLQ